MFTSWIHCTRVHNLRCHARLPFVLLKCQCHKVANFTEELSTIAYIQGQHQGVGAVLPNRRAWLPQSTSLLF